MNRIFPLAFVAVAAIGIAAPAFAKSFDPGVGAGNIVPFSVGPASRGLSARQRGLGAFAVDPPGAGGSSLSPMATGGGSIGYNENLGRDE